MHVVSNQIFEQQRNNIECALLLAQAPAGIELDDAVQTVIDRHLTVDHFSVFAQAPMQPPVLLAAGSRDRDGVSSALARAYATRFCKWDPLANGMPEKAVPGQIILHNRRAADVQNPSYRYECYDKPGITERLTVCSAARGVWWSLHLYRQRRSPSFNDTDAEEALKAAACILTALPTNPGRNPADPAAGSRSRLPWFIGRLRRLPVRLTERESEVCARALIGMTVEGTALDLGVAPTSVATYRKRAYQKLNITSQNEMFALLC